MNELAVTMRPVAGLVPYAKNARTHDDAQIDAICLSLKEFGWTNPVLVDGQNGIIAGHGRVMAATKLGMTEVPVIELHDLTPEQCRAYVIADNQLAMRAGWNLDMLRHELGELDAAGFDLAPLGFELPELLSIMQPGNPGQTDPDEVPEPPKIPISKRGDLWKLGKHRLICGDATSADDVAKVLRNTKPHLMVTDPPYGVEFKRGKYVSPEKAAKAAQFTPITNDNLGGDALVEFIAEVLKVWNPEAGVLYLWAPSLNPGYLILQGIQRAGFKVQSQVVWAKTPFVLGSADYQWQHEVAWYGFKGTKHQWYGGRDQGTVWNIPKVQKMDLHPTMKPVECMRRPIVNNSKAGDAVYDPFVGSGTTIIAAEMTGRACYALEIDPAYVDVAVERWQNFTGERATLDGRAFDDVRAERISVNA